MSNTGKPPATRGWDTYWKGTRDADSYASGGVRHPAITAFWDATLPKLLAAGDNPRILDIATGSGAVVESLFLQATDATPDITCVDISAAAIDSVRERYPGVTGIVADALSSQFGVEYAGMGALDEAARLLAPGGELAMLMHIRPGMIYDECRSSRDAVRRTQKAKFVERALAFFEAGFAAVRGADRGHYEKAGLALNPALRKVESILSDLGEDVAGGTIAKLYTDIERIHQRIQHYDSDEVLGWLQAMSQELDAYAERMASMCECALDTKTFRQLCQRLKEQGLTVVEGKPLLPARGSKAVAWRLHAMRAG